MENGQQEFQARIPLGRTWNKFPEDMSQIERLQRPYGNHQSWNSTRTFRLLEARANRIRENQASIKPIEEQLTQTGNNQIPSRSHGVGQNSSPVASHYSGTSRTVVKSHYSSQYQLVSRRRKGEKGKNKTSFNQRQKESDPMIQKLLELVKEVHKNQK
ncbi:hypothetical protein O181_105354 [Austropuccinia psidii MF-1]|uniref:Uncharacterized protein n=1 Tax=Austropuccinia psidii MF-1 TaxID=1389203 RepID=A0A9Q3PL11_9BASI|nr:hypothetical protein [Austropuccinia psidii MF-1]